MKEGLGPPRAEPVVVRAHCLGCCVLPRTRRDDSLGRRASQRTGSRSLLVLGDDILGLAQPLLPLGEVRLQVVHLRGRGGAGRVGAGAGQGVRAGAVERGGVGTG